MRCNSRQRARAYLALVPYLLIHIHCAFAQVPDDIRANLKGRGHALLIGVSRYGKDAWPELHSVSADIEDLAKGLAPHFATIDTLTIQQQILFGTDCENS